MCFRIASRAASLCLLWATSLAAVEPGPCHVVAHRGLLLHAPENTLANYRSCLGLRLGFEFDVRRTKDGQLVCVHDATVDRTTDGKGAVSELTLAETKRLDAGSWFDAKFAGETVPTVEEVLRLVADHRRHPALIAVDLKADRVEQDVVRLAERLRVLDRLVFIGSAITDAAIRKAIKSVASQALTAALANDAKEFERFKADRDVDWLYIRFLPTKEQVAAAHAAGKRVFIAGPLVSGNAPAAWRQGIEARSDGILTDYSIELSALMRHDAKSSAAPPY